jgi:hypothetical protein
MLTEVPSAPLLVVVVPWAGAGGGADVAGGLATCRGPAAWCVAAAVLWAALGLLA